MDEVLSKIYLVLKMTFSVTQLFNYLLMLSISEQVSQLDNLDLGL